MAKNQKEISVAEFFERNRQILGFDTMSKSLLTAVKEAVDNSLDACEELGILPEINVSISRIQNDEYRVIVEDNGPGIVRRQVPNVFGRLLYGSRFHSIRQSRGQQGIGISAVVMYSQITTGRPARIRTKTAEMDAALVMDLMLDTKTNRPVILKEDFFTWDREHGTSIEVEMKARYVSGRQSVFEYLKETALVNPHSRIVYKSPEGVKYTFDRATTEMPAPTAEIKPHPLGVEVGQFLNMAKATRNKKLLSFLHTEFSRVSYRVASDICKQAGIDPDTPPSKLTIQDAKAIIQSFSRVKIMAPPTDCLSPIGPSLIRKGLKNILGDMKPEFYAPPVTREPRVYRGHPFQVEVGIVYGGNIPSDSPVSIYRFANRVPLLYKQAACVTKKAVESIDWRRYGLEQRGGKGIPYGPAVILIHVASTQIPFTSESKEAIAAIPEIQEEIELALKACARKLKAHLRKKEKKEKNRVKFQIVQEILPQIAEKAASIVGKPVPTLKGTITQIMNVVWIDDDLRFAKDRYKVSIRIHNYTPTGKKFSVHYLLPEKGFPMNFSVSPKESRGQKLRWDLKRIEPTGSVEIKFEIIGLEKGDMDENEFYVSQISPMIVIGAEPLPGDWDVEKMKVDEVAEEDEGPDVDEIEDVLEEEGEYD